MIFTETYASAWDAMGAWIEGALLSVYILTSGHCRATGLSEQEQGVGHQDHAFPQTSVDRGGAPPDVYTAAKAASGMQ